MVFLDERRFRVFFVRVAGAAADLVVPLGAPSAASVAAVAGFAAPLDLAALAFRVERRAGRFRLAAGAAAPSAAFVSDSAVSCGSALGLVVDTVFFLRDVLLRLRVVAFFLATPPLREPKTG